MDDAERKALRDSRAPVKIDERIRELQGLIDGIARIMRDPRYYTRDRSERRDAFDKIIRDLQKIKKDIEGESPPQPSR